MSAFLLLNEYNARQSKNPNQNKKTNKPTPPKPPKKHKTNHPKNQNQTPQRTIYGMITATYNLRLDLKKSHFIWRRRRKAYCSCAIDIETISCLFCLPWVYLGFAGVSLQAIPMSEQNQPVFMSPTVFQQNTLSAKFHSSVPHKTHCFWTASMAEFDLLQIRKLC